MGLCGSSISEEDRKMAQRSRQIDDENNKDMDKEMEKVKLLLLGAGESGKSTVFKQMRLLYGAEYTEEERISFRLFIHQNIIETAEALCNATKNLSPDDPIILTPEFQKICPNPDTMNPNPNYRKFPELTTEYAEAVAVLWRSPTFKQTWENRSKFQIIESAGQFLDRVEKVASADYSPSGDDIILSRVKTTGIREERMQVGLLVFVFFLSFFLFRS